LTPEPIQQFHLEFIRISTLFYNLFFINETIGELLEDDNGADRLRSFLRPFNNHMFNVNFAFSETLLRARFYYAHTHEEIEGKSAPEKITPLQAQRLLDPAFQKTRIKDARCALTQLDIAIRGIQEDCLHRLPKIGQELNLFISEYAVRHRIMQERSQSWLPSIALDAIWGKHDPPTLSLEEVQGLLKNFQLGSKGLRQLIPLFVRMRAHLSRLSELDPTQMNVLGYTTVDDLVRLYRDRLTCHNILRDMDYAWDSVCKGFPSSRGGK
jgi:hypothetical protein